MAAPKRVQRARMGHVGTPAHPAAQSLTVPQVAFHDPELQPFEVDRTDSRQPTPRTSALEQQPRTAGKPMNPVPPASSALAPPARKRWILPRLKEPTGRIETD